MSLESGALSLTSVPRANAPVSQTRGLSECLWNIDFSAHFPMVVSDDGVTIDHAGPEEALEFTGEHYGALFGDPEASQFFSGDSRAARERYLKHACDVFVFKDGPRAVGLFIGNPVDWSTYYIRSMAFVDEYQGRTLHQRFFDRLFALLANAGVCRVEADTAPSNAQCASALFRQRFVVSGSVLSERWGALTRFTRHLDPEAASTFLGQFCFSGALHQQRNQRRRPEGDAVHKRGVTQ
jgi:hypothetical protein